MNTPCPAALSCDPFRRFLRSGVGVFVMCYDINIDAYVGATYPGIMVLPTTEAEIEAAYLQKELAGRWWILRRALERKWAYQYGRLAVDGPHPHRTQRRSSGTRSPPPTSHRPRTPT